MTSQLSQQLPRANKLSFPVAIRWSDQDVNGHVNNARILTLVEEARIQAGDLWWGSSPNEDPPRVVRAINVEYQRAVHYGPKTSMDVWISKIGNSSYEVSHELFQDGNPCVRAKVVIVILDPVTRAPMSVPEPIREVLSNSLLSH